jgi:hypothetical protein
MSAGRCRGRRHAVAAALFSPLRRRVQHLVGPVVQPGQVRRDHTVAAFAARLRDTVDPDSVRVDLAAVVHTALEPTRVSVWLGNPKA